MHNGYHASIFSHCLLSDFKLCFCIISVLWTHSSDTQDNTLSETTGQKKVTSKLLSTYRQQVGNSCQIQNSQPPDMGKKGHLTILTLHYQEKTMYRIGKEWN